MNSSKPLFWFMPLFPPVVECRVRPIEIIHSKAVDAIVLNRDSVVAGPVAISLIDIAANELADVTVNDQARPAVFDPASFSLEDGFFADKVTLARKYLSLGS